MINKLGTYTQNLMSVVVDNTQDEFVKQLAIDELLQIKNSLIEFLAKHNKTYTHKITDNRILLQEDKDV